MKYQDRWLTLGQVQRLLGVDGLQAFSNPGSYAIVTTAGEREVRLSAVIRAYRPSDATLSRWLQRIEADELLTSEMQAAKAGLATFLQRAEVDQLLAREAPGRGLSRPSGGRPGLRLPSTLEPRPARWS